MARILPPLLLMTVSMMIPVMSRLNSVQVSGFRGWRKSKGGPVMCALDTADVTTTPSSRQDCGIKCALDASCTGININTPVLASASRTHSAVININTPVLASASRTHSPVININTPVSTHSHVININTPVLASASRTHSPDININTPVSTHSPVININTPVLASASRTHSPVLTSIHLYWHQPQCTCISFSIKNSLACHQHQYACTGINLVDAVTCEMYKYHEPKVAVLVPGCQFYKVRFTVKLSQFTGIVYSDMCETF